MSRSSRSYFRNANRSAYIRHRMAPHCQPVDRAKPYDNFLNRMPLPSQFHILLRQNYILGRTTSSGADYRDATDIKKHNVGFAKMGTWLLREASERACKTIDIARVDLLVAGMLSFRAKQVDV
jgi:hypothetical protein